MLHDVIEFVGCAIVDMVIGETSKRYRFIRILNAIVWPILLAAIAAAMYLTVKYS